MYIRIARCEMSLPKRVWRMPQWGGAGVSTIGGISTWDQTACQGAVISNVVRDSGLDTMGQSLQ